MNIFPVGNSLDKNAELKTNTPLRFGTDNFEQNFPFTQIERGQGATERLAGRLFADGALLVLAVAAAFPNGDPLSLNSGKRL